MYRENMKVAEVTYGPKGAVFGFLKGVLISAVVTVLVFLVFAFFLAYTKLPEGAIPVIAIVTEAIGALIAGYGTAKGTKSRGFLSGLLSGAVYILIIWLIGSLISDGFYLGKHFFTMLGFSALGGAIGGILGVNLKTGKTNKRKR